MATATNDITVTTATRTPEQVRETLGVSEKPAAPAVTEKPAAAPAATEKPIPAAIAEPATAPSTDAELEAAIDEAEPPKPNETPEQKQERQSRGTKKILKEMSLRKAAEERADRLEKENATLRRAPKPDPPPPAGEHKADDPATAAAKPAATEQFTFPTFAEYQEKHPEAEYSDYTDARTDARYAWNEKKTQETQQKAQALAKRQEQFDALQTHEKSFTTDHPDYDAVVSSVPLGDADPRLVVDLQKLLVDVGKDAPGILYYLGQHADEAKRILDSPSRTALVVTFGEIKHAAKLAATAKPAPAGGEPLKPATKPATHAPAPISEVKGGSQHTRTLQQVAEDSEDADAYIAMRQKELRPTG